MKKNTLFLSLSVLALASCSSNNNETIVEEKLETISFSVSSTPETRAYWTEDHLIHWEEGDSIMVYATQHTDGHAFNLVNSGIGQVTSDFTGETYTSSEVHASHNYFVVYPFIGALEFNGVDKVKVEIPQYQNATIGSFDKNACVQITKTKNFDGIINMSHVCGFLKIKVSAGCEYVQVSAGGYGVAGQGWSDYVGHIDGSDWVADKKYEFVKLQNIPSAGTYLIGIAPSSGYSNFTVSVKYSDQEPITKTKSSSTQQIEKGYVYSLGDWSTDITVTVPPIERGQACTDCPCDQEGECHCKGCEQDLNDPCVFWDCECCL